MRISKNENTTLQDMWACPLAIVDGVWVEGDLALGRLHVASGLLQYKTVT